MITARTYFALLAAGVVLIVLSYNFVDIPVARWSFAQGEGFEHFCEMLSLLGESTWYIAVSLLGWAFYRYRAKRRDVAGKFLFVFAAILGSGVAVAALKFLFGRARPWMLEKRDEYGFFYFEYVTPYVSFPSGHTTTAFALATALSILMPRGWAAWYAFATVMALARIGVPDHYVSDTIAGALLGSGVTLYIAARYRTRFFKAQ